MEGPGSHIFYLTYTTYGRRPGVSSPFTFGSFSPVLRGLSATVSDHPPNSPEGHRVGELECTGSGVPSIHGSLSGLDGGERTRVPPGWVVEHLCVSSSKIVGVNIGL